VLERLTPVLRLVCIALAGLILYQVFQVVAHKDPLENLSVATAYSLLDAPDIPTPALAPAATPAALSTNAASVTNSLRATITNTNTNMPAVMGPGTNVAATRSTNAVRVPNAAAARAAVKPPGDLPPALQARVDRLTQSELLGPVVRPLPMALIGIAGKDVLIRTANGQTGLLREGEELGGVKLLRIGTNRVLVEHEQQQKELTVFAGAGGESLVPAPQADKKPQ
jgi:hypothetical protein